ncbi:MAG: DUF5357 family protein [Cyanobacteria bacterium P01_A01_bin.114]
MLAFLQDLFKNLRELLIPQKYFAWQTLLLLSLFSWLLAQVAAAAAAHTVTVDVLTICSWLFLSIAIWWALAKNPVLIPNTAINISPWITGVIFCIFLFNPWTEERFRLALMSWPIVSTIIAGSPEFVEKNWKQFKQPKTSVRQSLAMLLLINLLLSSWLIFFFRVQSWLEAYPSLLVDTFDRSNFVVRVESDQRSFSQGTPLLEDAALALNQELEGVPWPQVERWLINIDDGIRTLASSVNITAPAERVFWSLNAPLPDQDANGYELRLRANWLGPTSQKNGYFLEKVCRIAPRSQPQVIESGPSPDQSSTIRRELTDLATVDCASGDPTMTWVEAPVES